MAAIDRVISAAVDSVKKSGVLEAGALMATVSAVNSDGTVTVTRGDDTYPKVRLLTGYANPAVNDKVEIIRTSGGWVCVGALVYASPAAWTTLALASGWTAYGSPYGTPSCRVNQDGTVSLSGVAKHAGAAAGTTVLTLPADIRPPFKQRFVVEVAGSKFGVADIETTGVLSIGDFASTAGFVTFDPIRYRIA